MVQARAWVAFALAVLLTGCTDYEGQVLRHWMFRAGDLAHPITLPVHLSDELPKHRVTYRMSADVVLERELRGRDVDLVIPHLPARVLLRVGGAAVPSNGPPTTGDADRHIGPHRWSIPSGAADDGRLSIVLEVTHAWTQSAWLDVAPRLVPSGAETRVMERNRLLNDDGAWFGLIGLSQMGFTFLAIYFWDRRRRAYLWFAIQALSASYYPAYVLGWTTRLGIGPEHLLLAQSLSIAPVASVYFTYEFFDRGKPHRVWLFLLAIGMLGPLPAAFSTFIDVSYAAAGVIACVAAGITTQIATGIRLSRTYADRRMALFFLCCWLALGGSAWVDLWAWFGGGEILAGARPACIGLGLFGIFQSMILSRSHIRSLQEADRLNATLTGRLNDLEQRQAEIQALNEELRQQVGRRSTNILAALQNATGAQTSVALEPGSVIEDRYRVIGALGAGGMGTVYEVERLHDRRRLALKVTLESRGLDVARLAREAQVATRVRHPNVVAVVDADVAQAGYVYIVMELVEGCSLADCEGRHGVPWCLRLLTQILQGLEAIHAQGIIHRDLKPGNVLLSGDPEKSPHAKITDFGISRSIFELEVRAEPPQQPANPAPRTIRMGPKRAAADATDSDAALARRTANSTFGASTPQLTRTGAISGTPSYVAPELARATARITPAVDVFSFGVVAYRLLTGEQPHHEAPLLARLDGREPPVHASLSGECPELPERIATLIDACLAFAPEMRPSTSELLRAIDGAAHSVAVQI